jgi:hypothetical protein
MMKAARLDNADGLTLELRQAPLAERLADLKAVLYALDAEDDIDAGGVFESGLVVVAVEVGTKKASVDFHLAWPEPQLNNQHLSVVRLRSWTVSGVTDEQTAVDARKKAKERLVEAIEALTAPGAELEGAVRVLGGG